MREHQRASVSRLWILTSNILWHGVLAKHKSAASTGWNGSGTCAALMPFAVESRAEPSGVRPCGGRETRGTVGSSGFCRVEHRRNDLSEQAQTLGLAVFKDAVLFIYSFSHSHSSLQPQTSSDWSCMINHRIKVLFSCAVVCRSPECRACLALCLQRPVKADAYFWAFNNFLTGRGKEKPHPPWLAVASVPLVTSQMADFFIFIYFLPNKTQHVSRRGRSQYLAVGEDGCAIVALCDVTRG